MGALVPDLNERNAGSSLHLATGIALLAAVYFLAGRLGFLASAVHPVVSSAWPPSGIALAALLLYGKRLWPGITIGAFVVNVTGGIAPLAAASIAVGNSLEGLLAAWHLVMPGIGGRELARQCGALGEDLKVIYLSGYTRDSLLSQETFEEGTEFIEKPFTRDAILDRISRVMRS